MRWKAHLDRADSWHASSTLRYVFTLIRHFNTRLRERNLKIGMEPLPRKRSNSQQTEINEST